MFDKLLVANRGEIACRVMRTARRMGLRTVAVFSDPDAQSPHVAMADEAVRIGPAPAAQSYLRIDALLEAARRTSAQAVHPGYGFLSENAAFARACTDAGLAFVGPPAQAIRAMGDKAQAKRRMIEAGVPCAPGTLEDDLDDAALAREAARIGTPLLVKAVAGGGGRGMRTVHELSQLHEAVAAARREAQSAFGDGRVMLERLIEHGRHIEVQVFADTHGQVLHLGERDCTAQRRRQKLVEESPSPVVNEALRQALGADAVAAARAVGYVGAGTVEFIVGPDRRHLFLEMNTRLQVEHPVTECVTGLDLVEWQLRVAAGQALPWRQQDIRLEGHAIEVRLVAEDPYDGFRPQTGTVRGWDPQPALASAAGALRIDHGLAEGMTIGPHYDGMVAKLIAHGRTRADAVRVLRRGLCEAPLFGPAHNARFLFDLLAHPAFTSSTMTTATVDAWAAQREPLLQRPEPPEAAWRLAAALRAGPAPMLRPAGLRGFDLALECGGTLRHLRCPLEGVTVLERNSRRVVAEVDGTRVAADFIDDGATLWLAWDAQVFAFTEPSAAPRRECVADPRRAVSPVAGTVARVTVREGDRVERGSPLASVEAMKMEMWLHAEAPGTVSRVAAQPGAAVAAGQLLVELEIDP